MTRLLSQFSIGTRLGFGFLIVGAICVFAGGMLGEAFAG